MLRGVHYAHMIHMQITWCCLYIIFSWSKFPTEYDRLSQQQLGFFFVFDSVKVGDIVPSLLTRRVCVPVCYDSLGLNCLWTTWSLDSFNVVRKY